MLTERVRSQNMYLRGTAGFAGVVAGATLAPLDANLKALHVEAIELSHRVFGRLLRVVLNERV